MIRSLPALLLVAGCSGAAAPRAPDSPAFPVAPGGVLRLLPGPLGDGVAWEIASPWHAAPLPAARPEAGLEPLLRCDFDGPDGTPAGWLVHPSFARLARPDAADAPPPSTRGGVLELSSRASLAARIVPIPPLTPCVLLLRVKQPDAAASETRLLLADLREDPSSLADPVAIAERIEAGAIVSVLREIGREPPPPPKDPAAAEASIERPRPEIVARDERGFETWRVELSSGWGARALLLVAFGSDAGPVALDDVTLHVVPARRLLGLPASALGTAAFDLPRPWENLDPRLRATKVRADWESRRALLLPRGAVARCRAPRPPSGGALALGFAIVREDRLTLAGPHREVARVKVGPERSDGSIVRREVALELRADAPSLWRDLEIPLGPAADAAGDLEIEIRIDGEDAADGALVAVSDPMLLPGAPAGDPQRATPRDPAPPNLLLISLDTMRADRLGRKVGGRSLTPNLDALAAKSVRFTQALANSSYTLPSHVSLFTSQRPGEHGLFTVFDSYSARRSASLAEIAGRAGFATAAFTSGGMLNAEFCGVDRGFDRFGEIDSLLSPHDRLRRTAPLRDRPDYNRAIAAANRLDASVVPWLRANRGRPFVLFLHTYLCHDYQPEPALAGPFTRGLPPTPLKLTGPIPYRGLLTEEWKRGDGRGDDRFDFEGEGERRFVPERDLPWAEALYDATVAQADRDVGRLLSELDALGLAESTIVVVTADHGEEFLEHGDLGHARTLFDEILRVPLLIRAPGIAPRVVDDPVELIDVAPTLLARMGLPADPRMRGADLLAESFEPRAITIHEGVEGGSARAGAHLLRAARSRGSKLVVFAPREHVVASTVGMDVLEQLRALGYVGGAAGEAGFFDLREDPAERVDLAAGGSGTLPPAQASRLQALLEALHENEGNEGRGGGDAR
jgi:arylsulfatase A-like enzyme